MYLYSLTPAHLATHCMKCACFRNLYKMFGRWQPQSSALPEVQRHKATSIALER